MRSALLGWVLLLGMQFPLGSRFSLLVGRLQVEWHSRGLSPRTMSVFAAVDIGANSVRLKIARVVRHRLRTVHEKRVVTRLGESVFREGTLSPESMDATVEVLRKFRRAVREFSADRVRVAATSALRDARNSLAFVAWARLATGWKVETVSGLEEGRLIHLGVVANTRIGKRNVLLVDLGGGSCEITASEKGHIREMVSLPLGAVRLTEEFLRHDPPRRSNCTGFGPYRGGSRPHRQAHRCHQSEDGDCHSGHGRRSGGGGARG